MKNDNRIIDEITQKIEERACYGNPGPVAVEAGQFIDENFLVIRRSDLPEVQISRHTGKGHTDRLHQNTAGGNPETLRNLANHYLAMAEFIDSQKENEAEKKLNEQRFKMYTEMYPTFQLSLEEFNYVNLSTFDKRILGKLIDLQNQIDK